MSLFGLDPSSILARVRAQPQAVKAPSLLESAVGGGLGFCLVSAVVFGTVAFAEKWLYTHAGLWGTYLIWTLLFIGGGGVVFNRLITAPGCPLRFYAVFALSFLLYAAAWTAAYFALKGVLGEWVGVVAGALVMAWFFCGAFGCLEMWLRVGAVLLGGNIAGYFIGRLAWAGIGGKAGMLSWGILYGLAVGAGIGSALHICQAKVRQALSDQWKRTPRT